jgi:hypothetical protein
MGLDINTPKGQKTVLEERKMLNYIRKCWNVEIKITKKDKPYPYDGIILIDNKIVGVFECKNRQITLEELENWGSWLITYKKLEDCRLIAKEKKVPFYGFLGIEKDILVMFWKISDAEGNYLFEFNHHHSESQDNVNGGESYRDNAYLPIEFGKFVQPNQIFVP